jgi:hypothetical protein
MLQSDRSPLVCPHTADYRSRSLTRKATRIERNVVTCYMMGKPDWAKERIVNTFVGRKSAPSTTGSEDGELAVLRAIGAVVDKDVPRYLYVRLQAACPLCWSDGGTDNRAYGCADHRAAA